MRTIFFIAFLCIIPNTALGEWRSDPRIWKQSRLVHGEAKKDLSVDTFSHIPLQDNDNTVEKTLSPNAGYWFALVEKQKNRRSYNLYVYNERDYLIDIFLDDTYPNFSPPKVRWINEKLLFIRYWYGRIVGVDSIFDVEKESFIYKEGFIDGQTEFIQNSCFNIHIKDESEDCIEMRNRFPNSVLP